MTYRSLQSGHTLSSINLVSIYTAADPDSIIVGGSYADPSGTQYILRNAYTVSPGLVHCVLQAQEAPHATA